MNLGQQVAHLRKVRGYTQEELCKKARVGISLYKEFELGTKRMNERYLHNVLIILEGTLIVAPFRFKHHKAPSKINYTHNIVSAGGVSLWDAWDHMNKLFKEMPNLLLKEPLVDRARTGTENFMKGEFKRYELNLIGKECQLRYKHYNEIENGHKISGVEKKTISLEMRVMELLTYLCMKKHFHKVPKIVQELLRED